MGSFLLDFRSVNLPSIQRQPSPVPKKRSVWASACMALLSLLLCSLNFIADILEKDLVLLQELVIL